MTNKELDIVKKELKNIKYYHDLRAQRYEKIADKLNEVAPELGVPTVRPADIQTIEHGLYKNAETS